MLLISNFTGGNTSSDVIDPVKGIIEGKGKSAWAVIRAGDYDGATVTLQYRSKEDPLDRWDDIGNASFTEDSQVQLQSLVNGSELRAVISGSGGNTTNLTVSVLGS